MDKNCSNCLFYNPLGPNKESWGTCDFFKYNKFITNAPDWSIKITTNSGAINPYYKNCKAWKSYKE